ncbi:hypothetical protein A2W32_00500 [candidate division WWE3 bacterium RBG_16_37_10]|uniref:Uncharacterized protein n=1 Tax=candidate division WWE3 bacterium RBG_16_37_10 TaxID=1802610 RepID=A0A1F4V1P5_UNCKA|nr:MAG: hypothetical protein A2W32_00500 [candidate division WWE3 bacterium RBG_16_37_10]
MNRNKLNVKMDLLRAAKTAFEINKPFDRNITKVFLNKAKDEFENKLPQETLLKNELMEFSLQIDDIVNDPLKRIHWGEKVMTLAARLGSN